MKLAYWWIGSIVVCLMGLLIYKHAIKEQSQRLVFLMHEEAIDDVAELIPRVVNIFYVLSIVPIINMLCTILFMQFINKVESICDSELRRVLIQSVD